jgi:hypothetical protein
MSTIESPAANRAETERTVMMRLSVEVDSLARVRQMVLAACGTSVQFLRTQKIPRSTLVGLWLVLAEIAVPAAIGATLRAAPHGEISPVHHQIQTSNQP